ncbi:MAG: hypothetical protein COV76_06730 [Candidatus Omnitrophica bacterium CG11_big_fil_rev_8_21_14_0_20_64_10]|nr:MAG: hypothetical protein COV76_06730 [Candidatus Omnitrophica bacterium CG11_big_fil_rev_8_21_14_0_20_64_10]
MVRGQGEEKREVHRVVTFLDREQVDYLDKLGKDALFSTGVKFPRTRIISALIEVARKIGLNGEGLRAESELGERLKKRLSGSDSEARRLAGQIKEAAHARPA